MSVIALIEHEHLSKVDRETLLQQKLIFLERLLDCLPPRTRKKFTGVYYASQVETLIGVVTVEVQHYANVLIAGAANAGVTVSDLPSSLH